MTDDPFAAYNNDPEPEPTPEPVPAKKTAKKAPSKPAAGVSSEGKVVVTLKGGGGFDEPWIVIHAESIEDAIGELSKLEDVVKLMDLTQSAAKAFRDRSTSTGGNSGGGGAARPARSNAPREAQQPPDDAPDAPGPDWVFKAGFSQKTNKPWRGWMPPRGSNESPLFF